MLHTNHKIFFTFTFHKYTNIYNTCSSSANMKTTKCKVFVFTSVIVLLSLSLCQSRACLQGFGGRRGGGECRGDPSSAEPPVGHQSSTHPGATPGSTPSATPGAATTYPGATPSSWATIVPAHHPSWCTSVHLCSNTPFWCNSFKPSHIHTIVLLCNV